MKIQLIRHATMLIYIGNKKILVDPMLSSKGMMPSIPDVENKNNNPLVELPVDINTLLDADAILLTHTHWDHFDNAAMKALPKDIAVFCQSEDTEKIQSAGFNLIYPIEESLNWNDITFVRTKGQHGDKEMSKKMGPSSGFIIRGKNEPCIYITGDTIWYDEIEKTLELYHPEIIISFAGEARFSTGNPITMNAEDIYCVCKKAPYAKIIVVHMEVWNHCVLSRKELKEFLIKKSIDDKVYIPYDGEVMSY